MKLSVSGRGGESSFITRIIINLSEETNYDDDVNAEANEIDDKNKDMVVTMEEDNKTLEYQKTMNLDIENIAIKINHFGYQYMKLLMIHILE